jgi:soluble lytic murein transglycosylase-like protein
MDAGGSPLRLATCAAVRAYAATKNALAIVGLISIWVFVALPVPRESLMQNLAAFRTAPAVDGLGGVHHSTTAAGPIKAVLADPNEASDQRALAQAIAKRYRVAEQAATWFVSLAYQAGQEFKVDPVLVLAVMAIESRFNPVARSHMGAKGLMQVIPKFHPEKLVDHGGAHALLDPPVNIHVGTQILREYLRRFGETETALQMYAGALDEPKSIYATKVLAEKARLEARRDASASIRAAAQGSS